MTENACQKEQESLATEDTEFTERKYNEKRFWLSTLCVLCDLCGLIGVSSVREQYEELISLGHLVSGSRTDLGRVGTGVAVLAGTPLPEVSNARALLGNILAAKKIVCPDPATATAGKVVMRMVEGLGIAGEVTPRMQYFPNGYTAMKWLAASRGVLEMGITQITEILANRGVTYVGPLPDELQMKTVYSAALATRAQSPEAAGDFIARLTAASARPVLAQAGYEFDD